MTDKPYEGRSGGRYTKSGKSQKAKLVERTQPSDGPEIAAAPQPEAVPPAPAKKED
ncbi:hypothetical protein [Aliihoeflea sp. PC F10.4]